MSLKIIGAILVIVGSGSFGFLISASHIKEEKNLRQINTALEYMECDLQYRLTPLPQLFIQVSKQCCGYPHSVFWGIGSQLEAQDHPDIQCCVESILINTKGGTPIAYNIFQRLGCSLGHFELDGQLKGIRSVREECNIILGKLVHDKDARLRAYKTLGLCVGAALAILFV